MLIETALSFINLRKRNIYYNWGWYNYPKNCCSFPINKREYNIFNLIKRK